MLTRGLPWAEIDTNRFLIRRRSPVPKAEGRVHVRVGDNSRTARRSSDSSFRAASTPHCSMWIPPPSNCSSALPTMSFIRAVTSVTDSQSPIAALMLIAQRPKLRSYELIHGAQGVRSAQRAIRRAETWEKPLRVVGLQLRDLDCDDCGIDQALSMMISDAFVSLACGGRHEQVDRVSSHLVARSRLAVTRRASSVVDNAWRSFRDMLMRRRSIYFCSGGRCAEDASCGRSKYRDRAFTKQPVFFNLQPIRRLPRSLTTHQIRRSWNER